jgi:hypothetical protein
MHSNSLSLRSIREASARGKKMAEARWKKDRARRAAWAAAAEKDPLRVPGRILQRVVVIAAESRVVEIIRRDNTSAREWARLKKKVGL